jgi:energy-coupling factor transport system substrate-specific component
VTWRIATTVLVLAALVAGFGWYERGRPSAKLVAMVAALAALAVAGRVLFAAIPNVQATTDVVLISGYALGAGPGFAVGAVAALASNLFLGQGPWTPWQMVGWGAVGVAGAGLAAVSGRLVPAWRTRPNRWLLVAVCTLAGFTFGAWMDLFTLVTFSAERSPDAYLAISATSLPFNVAHAAGNALLCMLLGPAFLRLLLRFRRRFEIEWVASEPTPRPAGAGTAAAALIAALLLAAGVQAKPAEAATGPRAAVRYVENAQNLDGGFGAAPRQRSSQLMTGWAVLGLEAGGRNPLEVSRGGRTPIDFMRTHARALTETGEIERTVMALAGAGLPVRRLGGENLFARLLSRQRANGSFDGQANWTAFGILALRAAGRPSGDSDIRRAAAWLVRQQSSDGGFSFSGRIGGSDVDDTGAVLQALAASDRGQSKTVRRALRYLHDVQNLDGGFGQLLGQRSNAQSTAWAIQGIVAAGEGPRRFRRKGGRAALPYLESLQQGDGSFRYSRTSTQTPVWVTAQAVAAVRLQPFPLKPLQRRSSGRSRESVSRRPHVSNRVPRVRRLRGPVVRRPRIRGIGTAPVGGQTVSAKALSGTAHAGTHSRWPLWLVAPIAFTVALAGWLGYRQLRRKRA